MTFEQRASRRFIRWVHRRLGNLLLIKATEMRPTLFALYLASLFVPIEAFAASVTVTTVTELQTAIRNAAPGDIITLAPGVYDITGNIVCATPGNVAAPITVRAAQLGD